MNLRPYQITLAEQGAEILRQRGIVYYAMEMRVGKTLIALETARLVFESALRRHGWTIGGMAAYSVLFVTKKKAIGSVKQDYLMAGFTFGITVINYEQLSNIMPEKGDPGYDLVIVDEAHSCGAFPKPSQRQQLLRRIVKHGDDGDNTLVILLSGTPSPESTAQLYHQFQIAPGSPFRHKNFYRWADEFVKVRERRLHNHVIKDYSNADRDAVMAACGDYFLYYTQADAGFGQHEVIEEVKPVPMDPRIADLIQMLLTHRYYRFNDGVEEIVCDTPAKLQQKIHQVCSGTVITESGVTKTLVTDKIAYIKKHYAGKKIAVFYKFVAEGNALRAAFPTATDNPEIFATNCEAVFVCQIQSGAMGINLSGADVLVFYNIDFSSQLYWQARARLSDKNRTSPQLVHWLFSQGGIEEKIYKAVLQKKDYTTYYFRQDYLKPIIMTEQKLQSDILHYLRKQGCYAVKVISAGKAGVPDILCCYQGQFIGIEVKAPGKKPTELQKYNLRLITTAGGISLVTDDVEAVKVFFNQLQEWDNA